MGKLQASSYSILILTYPCFNDERAFVTAGERTRGLQLNESVLHAPSLIYFILQRFALA